LADSFVQVAPDGAGRKVDTSQLVDGANIVERQRVAIGDDNDPNAMAVVDAGGLSSKDDTLIVLLASLISRLPMPDNSDAMRVSVIGGTLTTLSNITQIGGLNANTSMFDNMTAAANGLYNSITVT
jgi:hypothetical protein